MIFGFVNRWLGGHGRAGEAGAVLHAHIVRQARHPAFYTALAVPDTLDGRFDLLVLHLFFVLHRLKGAGGAAETAARGVFEAAIDGFDGDLRQEGIGDSGLARRMDTMLRGVAGRLGAYGAAFGSDDPRLLEIVLDNNVFGTVPQVPDRILKAMARYARSAVKDLGECALERVLTGAWSFPEPSP